MAVLLLTGIIKGHREACDDKAKNDYTKTPAHYNEVNFHEHSPFELVAVRLSSSSHLLIPDFITGTIETFKLVSGGDAAGL